MRDGSSILIDDAAKQAESSNRDVPLSAVSEFISTRSEIFGIVVSKAVPAEGFPRPGRDELPTDCSRTQRMFRGMTNGHLSGCDSIAQDILWRFLHACFEVITAQFFLRRGSETTMSSGDDVGDIGDYDTVLRSVDRGLQIASYYMSVARKICQTSLIASDSNQVMDDNASAAEDFVQELSEDLEDVVKMLKNNRKLLKYFKATNIEDFIDNSAYNAMLVASSALCRSLAAVFGNLEIHLVKVEGPREAQQYFIKVKYGSDKPVMKSLPVVESWVIQFGNFVHVPVMPLVKLYDRRKRRIARGKIELPKKMVELKGPKDETVVRLHLKYTWTPAFPDESPSNEVSA